MRRTSGRLDQITRYAGDLCDVFDGVGGLAGVESDTDRRVNDLFHQVGRLQRQIDSRIDDACLGATIDASTSGYLRQCRRALAGDWIDLPFRTG